MSRLNDLHTLATTIAVGELTHDHSNEGSHHDHEHSHEHGHEHLHGAMPLSHDIMHARISHDRNAMIVCPITNTITSSQAQGWRSPIEGRFYQGELLSLQPSALLPHPRKLSNWRTYGALSYPLRIGWDRPHTEPPPKVSSRPIDECMHT